MQTLTPLHSFLVASETVRRGSAEMLVENVHYEEALHEFQTLLHQSELSFSFHLPLKWGSFLLRCLRSVPIESCPETSDLYISLQVARGIFKLLAIIQSTGHGWGCKGLKESFKELPREGSTEQGLNVCICTTVSGLRAWLCHPLAMWLWTSFFLSWCFSSSWGRWKRRLHLLHIFTVTMKLDKVHVQSNTRIC